MLSFLDTKRISVISCQKKKKGPHFQAITLLFVLQAFFSYYKKILPLAAMHESGLQRK